MRRFAAAATLSLCLLALWSSGAEAKHKHKHYCDATSDAIAALQSDANVSVHHIPGTGFAFHSLLDRSRLFDGKAIIIVPDHDVAPQAYAPLARGKYSNTSLLCAGNSSTIARKSTITGSQASCQC